MTYSNHDDHSFPIPLILPKPRTWDYLDKSSCISAFIELHIYIYVSFLISHPESYLTGHIYVAIQQQQSQGEWRSAVLENETLTLPAGCGTAGF